MDIQAYIESGIIESYVLRLASEQEVAEVEELRSQHPQIEEAISSFSSALESFAMSESVQPPSYIKASILNALIKENDGSAVTSLLKNDSTLKSKNNIIALRPWKLMAAASIILFLFSSAFNFYIFNRYKENKQAYQALLSERNSLFADNKVYQASQVEWERTSKMMADPDMVMVKMKTAPGKKNNDATVFWNSRSKEVYVVAKEMPQPAPGKQFQLWAMVDGKPVDAGTISANCAGICKMKNIPRAQAFAITLENEGGSPSPHLDQLFVIGNI